jgi:ribonuclease BN (tRNA processing enzyme)
MRLRVLGSSGTYPVPGNPASGYLIEHAGSSVWLDAGPGSLVAFAEFADPSVVDLLVLTHVHGDHCLDLFPFFNLLRYGPQRRTGLPVVVPEGAASHLAAFARAGPDHDFYRVFDWTTVTPPRDMQLGELTLRFGAAAHPVPALVVRVDAGDRSLVYSGDSGPGGDLPDLAAGASVLLCEATMQGERTATTFPFHLTASEAGEMAAAAGAGRLVLTHLAPTLDSAVSVAEAAGSFGGLIDRAVPGMEIEV